MLKQREVQLINQDNKYDELILEQLADSKNSLGLRISKFIKRIVDIVVAAILLCATLPLLVIFAILVKSDGGTVFFRQQRVGFNGKLFLIIKIRSMITDAEAILRQDTALYKRYMVSYSLSDDSRATNIGRLLRATHLDEIPQLWNVIRGDMSMVGPRPVLVEETEQYGDLKNEILSVRPGLTGLWQINRHRAPEYPERACIEVSYVRNWSLLLDVQLILSTIVYVSRQITKETIKQITKNSSINQ